MAGQPDKRAGFALKATRSESYGVQALGLPRMKTEELVDIEESLKNDFAHFRTTHRECAYKVAQGMIIEANCGELYRAGGQKILIQDRLDKCESCQKHTMSRPCPVCKGS